MRQGALFFLLLAIAVSPGISQLDWSQVLFPKTVENDPVYAINSVTGNGCCNECLFLPSLQPCVSYPFGIMPQTFSWDICVCCSCSPFYNNFMWTMVQGWDRVAMCLQGTASTSSSVPVQYEFLTTDEVGYNFAGMDDIAFFWGGQSISCDGNGQQAYGTGVGYVTGIGANEPCAPYGQISVNYQQFQAQVPVASMYFPYTDQTTYLDPNGVSARTSETWVQIDRSAGQPQGNVLHYGSAVDPPGTVAGLTTPSGSRCSNGTLCFDNVTPSLYPAKTNTWAYGGYNGFPGIPTTQLYAYKAQYLVASNPCGIFPMPEAVWADGNVWGNVCPAGNNWPTNAPYIPDFTPYSASVWCDAPSQYSSSAAPGTQICSNNNAQNDQYLLTDNLISTRGCSGWGVCPISAVNGQTCGGNGQCMHNARCYCNAGWGGLACDQVIPSRPYFCSQFNPCSTQGYCDDATGQAQCICYTGWRGSPLDGTTLATNGELNLYIHAFLCPTGATSQTCLNSSVALDYMQDHQCLFFVDSTLNLDWSARYLRTTSSTIDYVISNNLGYTYNPLWYSGPKDPQLTTGNAPYNGLTSSQGVVNVTQAVLPGFNCIDGRVVGDVSTLPVEDQSNPILRGGPSCLPCPPCVTAHSTCVQDRSDTNPYSTKRVCQCFPNFGNSNSTNPICDAQICPTFNGSACGGSNQGTCNPNGGSSPYLGHCECLTGFTGNACQDYYCPVAPSSAAVGAGLICNGFTASTPNVSPAQISNYSPPPATNCVSGTCVCNGPYWALNPATGLCDQAGCAISPTTGLECNGLVVYGSSGGYSVSNSVCDRVRTGPSGLGTCQCYLARSPVVSATQSSVSFYGPTCSEPYNTSGICTSPISGLYCGTTNGDCYLSGTNIPGFEPPDPTAPPSCQCLTQYTGEWCDYSLCDPTVYPADTACTPIPQQPTGWCRAYTPPNTNTHVDQGSPTCNSGTCDWECDCFFVNVGNNNVVCDGSTGNSIIDSSSCVYYSNRNPFTGAVGISCRYPLQGCSYFDSALGSSGEWTVCGYAGETACQLQSSGSLGCVCPRAYSGEFCQNIVGCSGWCIGGSCPGTILDQETCNCDQFHTGLTVGSECSAVTPCCNTSTCGGPSYPGMLVTINNNTQCQCPAGSSYKSPTGLQPVCYQSAQSTFQGCSLDCPTTNGIECGGCNSVGAGNPSRCSSYTTLYGQGAPPTCDCSILAVDTGSGSSEAIPWTTSANGSCEPYCYGPGGTFNQFSIVVSPSNTWNLGQTNGPVCSCNAGHVGPRCNISFNPCQNGGIWDYSSSSSPVCLCGADGALNFPYSSASNCSQLMCDPITGTYSPSYSTTTCQCFSPYGLVGNSVTCSSLCQNGGTPDTFTQQCQCPAPYYGAYCQVTDCTNPTPTTTSCTCPQSYQYYDSTSNRCLNESCNQGYRSSAGPCVCDPFWSGVTCSTDRCAVLPSYGTAVATNSGNYTCQCDPGYELDANDLCTNTLCGQGGMTQPCGSSTQTSCALAGVDYNCLCGNGTFSINSNNVATCFAPNCGQHGSLVIQNQQYYCQCAAGWYTAESTFQSTHSMCTDYLCNLTYSTFSYWDTQSDSCQCYYPYDNPPNCTDFKQSCGPGSITPLFTVQSNLILDQFMHTLMDPLLVFDMTNPISASMTCACAPGYSLSIDPLMFNSNGKPPCVVNCFTNGTALAGLLNCTCLPQWSGEFCEIAPVPVSRTPLAGTGSSSSATLPVYGIVLITVGSALVIGGLVFLIVWLACHRNKGFQPLSSE